MAYFTHRWNGAAMFFDEFTADDKTKSGAGFMLGSKGFKFFLDPEKLRKIFLADAYAVVSDFDLDHRR